PGGFVYIPGKLTGDPINFTTVKPSHISFPFSFSRRDGFRKYSKTPVIYYPVDSFTISYHIVIKYPYDLPIIGFCTFGNAFTAKQALVFSRETNINNTHFKFIF